MKAWMQFIFPIYVWIISLLIILISKYSTHASRFFGNNSVPVLATLILLSYAKLLRAVISPLSVSHIQFLNGTRIPVWERDGNLHYLTGKHIPLMVLALTVLSYCANYSFYLCYHFNPVVEQSHTLPSSVLGDKAEAFL